LSLSGLIVEICRQGCGQIRISVSEIHDEIASQSVELSTAGKSLDGSEDTKQLHSGYEGSEESKTKMVYHIRSYTR
jgi:hypothetical protein